VSLFVSISFFYFSTWKDFEKIFSFEKNKNLFDKSRDSIRSRLRHAQELWLAEKSKNI
jgi:hypothetical protein